MDERGKEAAAERAPLSYPPLRCATFFPLWRYIRYMLVLWKCFGCNREFHAREKKWQPKVIEAACAIFLDLLTLVCVCVWMLLDKYQRRPLSLSTARPPPPPPLQLVSQSDSQSVTWFPKPCCSKALLSSVCCCGRTWLTCNKVQPPRAARRAKEEVAAWLACAEERERPSQLPRAAVQRWRPGGGA